MNGEDKPEALPQLGGVKGLISIFQEVGVTFQEVGTQIKDLLERLNKEGELRAGIEVRVEDGRMKIDVHVEVPKK